MKNAVNESSGKARPKPRKPLRLIALLLSLVLVTAGVYCMMHRAPNDVTVSNEADAIAHVKELGEIYGYENAMSELAVKTATVVDQDSYYRLQQQYEGIPVYGRNVILAADKTGSVLSVTGNPLDVDASVNLTPTVTLAQAVEAAHYYLSDRYGIETDSFCSGSLCIYNMGTDSKLAYPVLSGQYEVLVDAHTADIITIRQTTNAAQASPYAWKTTDGNYILRDTERNIYIYDAGKQLYWNVHTGKLVPSALSIVSSQDNVFGNKDDSTQTASTAVSLLYELASVRDFFKDTLYGETACTALAGVYDANIGDNAGGGLLNVDTTLPADPPGYRRSDHNGKIGVIIMGTAHSKNFSAATDIIGHEYTHILTDKYVNWCHSSVVNQSNNMLTETHPENGAIQEGLSDIFGELAEYHIYGKTDWVHNSRIISNPSANGYPDKLRAAEYNENGWVRIDGGTDYSHGYSTVISRAAYLMWNGMDGTPSKKIEAYALAELWYRAILMMPSDCTFIECRRLVELAASSMETLTEAQCACVSEAFDAVGIYSDMPVDADLTYQLKPGSTLSVLDKNNKPHTGYTLEVTGLKNTVLWHPDDDGTQTGYIGGTEFSLSTDVDNTPFTLDLPYGYYAFTVTDRYHPDLSYSFTASVGKSGLDDEVILYTSFEKPLIVTITDPAQSEITPGTYAEIDRPRNTLTVHTVSEASLSFTAFWYKVWDISDVHATCSDNTADFEYTTPGSDSLQASGTITFREDTAILNLTECAQPYIDTGEYRYQLVGRPFSEQQLKKISRELGVPEDLDVLITQGEPLFWKEADCYCTSVVIYHNGNWVAGANCHSLTGALVGNIDMYTKPEEFNFATTFGFTKAWDFHDQTEDGHYVTSLAFREDGTFYCAIGWYLSEWYTLFTGTYLTDGNTLILSYTYNGEECVISYQVDWEHQTVTQTSESSLSISHPVGWKYSFEENPWYTAEELVQKILLFSDTL